MTAARLRADARACFDAARAAVDPERLVAASLECGADGLALLRGAPAGEGAAMHRGPVLVVAAGKAAPAMMRGALRVVPAVSAFCVAPHGAAASLPASVTMRHGAHPVPDAAGAAATGEVLARVRAAGPDTLVVVLLSGGASALLVAPAAGLALEDKQALTRRLLEAGADIAALNTVRKHCSDVKGGGLARAAGRAAGCWTLLLSDVVGDDPAVIASGPTVPDPTTFADADAILRRMVPPDDVPPAVRARIAAGVAGRIPDTLKPGEPPGTHGRVRLLAGNRDAVAAAAGEARRRGYHTAVVEEPLVGDAAGAAHALTARLAAMPRDRAVAVVAGGETTVRVAPGGQGGRAQHLALAASLALRGLPAVLLAAGTDGVDGPTDAAGACVDGGTVRRAADAGASVEQALRATDSHRLLERTGDLLRTGATGTNVADVVVALRDAC